MGPLSGSSGGLAGPVSACAIPSFKGSLTWRPRPSSMGPAHKSSARFARLLAPVAVSLHTDVVWNPWRRVQGVVVRAGDLTYACRRDAQGGWRCGRCEQGVIVEPMPGRRCPVCAARRGRSRPPCASRRSPARPPLEAPRRNTPRPPLRPMEGERAARSCARRAPRRRPGRSRARCPAFRFGRSSRWSSARATAPARPRSPRSSRVP
jgi:hypothetical protein